MARLFARRGESEFFTKKIHILDLLSRDLEEFCSIQVNILLFIFILTLF